MSNGCSCGVVWLETMVAWVPEFVGLKVVEGLLKDSRLTDFADKDKIRDWAVVFSISSVSFLKCGLIFNFSGTVDIGTGGW